MHKVLLAALSLASLALAGCSGGDGDHTDLVDHTCPDGAIVTAAQQEANESHHEDGFDPAVLCPLPPKVTLTGLPATLGAYRNAPFTWALDPGSVAHGHSMLTSIRYSSSSVPAPSVMEDYAKELIKREHQDLPVTFKGNLTFPEAGIVYLRAYAQVQGENYARRDVWSEEVMVEILPVAATGTTITISHAAGLTLGEVGPAEQDAILGDALVLDNQDLVAHTFTQISGPEACDLTAEADSSSDPCLLAAPGTYEWRSDDQQPKTVKVRVAVPA